MSFYAIAFQKTAAHFWCSPRRALQYSWQLIYWPYRLPEELLVQVLKHRRGCRTPDLWMLGAEYRHGEIPAPVLFCQRAPHRVNCHSERPHHLPLAVGFPPSLHCLPQKPDLQTLQNSCCSLPTHQFAHLFHLEYLFSGRVHRNHNA